MNHQVTVNGYQFPDSPVFIGGLERSGKTYVRLMLAAHPAFAFSKRTNLWTHVRDRFGDLGDEDNLAHCLAAMKANRHIRALEPDNDDLLREFRLGPRSYDRLFVLMHRRLARREGKSCWGDQTEGIEFVAGPIFAALPNARLIHLIRDPRDRYEALVTRGPGRPNRLGEATRRWLLSAAAGAQNERRYPDRYRVVRYESLVLEPEKTLDEIAAWLGITVAEAMPALGHAPRFAALGNPERPLSADYIGRFRSRLLAHEIAYIQRQAGPLMLTYGYASEAVCLSWSGRLRCNVVTPLAAGIARLAFDVGRHARARGNPYSQSI